jgi:recombination protein RecA
LTPAGIRVKVKVVKNKVSAPFKSVLVDILFGTGIDKIGCLLDTALDLGIVERRGSWYTLRGQNMAQGRLNVVESLRSDPDAAAALEAEVRRALASGGGQSVLVDPDGDGGVSSGGDDVSMMMMMAEGDASYESEL